MAQVVVTIKLMPEGPESDMEAVQSIAEAKIDEFVQEKGEKRFAIKPIAFGLKSLEIIFVLNDKIVTGGTEPLEASLAEIEGVGGVEVIDVRRALG